MTPARRWAWLMGRSELIHVCYHLFSVRKKLSSAVKENISDCGPIFSLIIASKSPRNLHEMAICLMWLFCIFYVFGLQVYRVRVRVMVTVKT